MAVLSRINLIKPSINLVFARDIESQTKTLAQLLRYCLTVCNALSF